MTPSKFVALTATHATKLFGLYPRTGALTVGNDADIVIWSPKKRHPLSARV